MDGLRKNRDIGGDAAHGQATMTGGQFRLESIGLEENRGQDFYHFMYQPLTGDGEIVARIISVDGYEDAGIMFSYDPDFRWVTIPGDGAAADNAGERLAPGVRLQWVRQQGLTWLERTRSRPPNNDWGPIPDQISQEVALPVWVKIVRRAQTFSGLYSMDGTTWAPLLPNVAGHGSIAEIPEMPDTIWAGLFLDPHTTNRRVGAVFDQVSVKSTRR